MRSVTSSAGPLADAEIPSWDPGVCAQCGKCVIACPHAAIRAGLFDRAALADAPAGFKSRRAADAEGLRYTLQISPTNCSGCGICVEVCPARCPSDSRLKALRMHKEAPWHATDLRDWEFLLSLPDIGRTLPPPRNVRTLQFRRPSLEVGEPCASCGQTPYLHLLSRLFGDHIVVAQGTGPHRDTRCSRLVSSGRAADVIALREALDRQRAEAASLLALLAPTLGELAGEILSADQRTESGIAAQRRRLGALKRRLRRLDCPDAHALAGLAHTLVRRTIWAVLDRRPSDLDHILVTRADVNLLILDDDISLDTIAHDIAFDAIRNGDIYVASVALGARDDHAIEALLEAAAHEGPSLIFALGPCPGEGGPTDLRAQRFAVESGAWILFRHDPTLGAIGTHPFRFDSPQPREPITRRWSEFHEISRSRPESQWRAINEQFPQSPSPSPSINRNPTRTLP